MHKKEKGKEVELGTTEGVYVGEVSSDGAAHAAGIKEGDVITAVDGKKSNQVWRTKRNLS